MNTQISKADKQNDLEKEALVAKYLAVRDNGGENSAKELRSVTASLNDLFWKIVEKQLVRSIDIDTFSLNFSMHDALLIDFGLLDVRLVKNAPENFPQELLTERQITGLPKHFYLTEWLEYRLKSYEIEVAMLVSRDSQDSDNYSTRYINAYSDLENYLAKQNAGTGVKLPGVSGVALAAMTSGRLDQQLVAIGAGLLGSRQRSGLINRNRLVRLRNEIVSKLNLPSEATSLLDAVQRVYRSSWQQAMNNQHSAPTKNEDAKDATRDERAEAEQWLLEELKFVRALLPLGALAGGISRPCSVLLEYRPRVTRAHTKSLLERMPWCDRTCQNTPVVLIAPFCGRGVYEWDRDSLVAGVLPVSSPADAVANAVANYCMMLDSMQHRASIRAAYRAAFPKANFQQNFQQDYRKWLTEIADGDLTALSPNKLDFFADVIAPEFSKEPAMALSPPELRSLSATVRALLRKQILNQTVKNNWMSRYRLAILFWLDGMLPEALTEMANAANLAPKELHIAFAVGLLLIDIGQVNKAKHFFLALTGRAEQTIWKFYIVRVLERLG